MPKISELSDPGSGHNITGQEKIVAVTASLSTISLSASDLVGRSIDNIATGSVSNFKATHTDFNANSGKYESVYSNVNANSAEYESVYSTLNANSGDYSYVASNSATLQADTTILGTLSTRGTLSGGDNLIIQNRGTFGGDHIVTDNILTVFGNISAQGTIYASGSALGDVDPVNPGGSNRTIQYNDSSAFGGAAQFAYDEVNHNVGIGTQAIATVDNIHEKLTVAGNISATGKIYNEDGELGQVTPGGTDGAIQFNNSSTLSGNANLTFDDSNVRLGIGTPNPSHMMHVYGDGANGEIATERGSGAKVIIQAQAANGKIGTTTNHALGFNTNDTTRITISNTGKVGIGSTNPDELLTVAGNISANGNVHIGAQEASAPTAGTVDRLKIQPYSNTGGPYKFIARTVDGSTDYLELKYGSTNIASFEGVGGNVGIGTTNPDELLTVAGNISANGSLHTGGPDGYVYLSSDQDQYIKGDHGSNWIAFFTANDEKMRILSDGKVGINKTDPGYKLHVVESNTSTIAISAFGEIHAGGDIVSSSSSDRRQKTNIKKLDNALDKVLTLDGVEYDWNEMAAAHRIGKHDVGVIAQQVEEVLPDAVEHRENGMMAVRYERIIPLLIESIKELKSEIDELKGK